MRIPATLLLAALLALAHAAPRVGRAHPHLSPEQIRARIQELDALVPVVKRLRIELVLERAALWSRLGDLGAALLDCRRASRIDPKSPKPHVQAGEVLEVRGAFRAAATEYERALSLGANDPQIAWRLGNAYRELARFADAEAIFRRAADNGKDALAKAARLVDVAKMAERCGAFEEAVKVLDESLRLAKGWPAYRQARAELFMRMKRYREAAADYAAIVAAAEAPDDEFPMMVRHADALAAAGDPDAAGKAYAKAEAVITGLLNADPAFVEDLFYWRGKTRLAQGNVQGAYDDAREALIGLPDQNEYLELMVAAGNKGAKGPEAAKAVRGLAHARKFEQRAREELRKVRAEMREHVLAALAGASEQIIAEIAVDAAVAAAAKQGDGVHERLTAAAQRVHRVAADRADCAAWAAWLEARLGLASADGAKALAAIERALAADKENARYRRCRLRVAEVLGRGEMVKLDRAFLDELIKRSQDEDLLQPAPPKKAEKP